MSGEPVDEGWWRHVLDAADADRPGLDHLKSLLVERLLSRNREFEMKIKEQEEQLIELDFNIEGLQVEIQELKKARIDREHEYQKGLDDSVRIAAEFAAERRKALEQVATLEKELAALKAAAATPGS